MPFDNCETPKPHQAVKIKAGLQSPEYGRYHHPEFFFDFTIVFPPGPPNESEADRKYRVDREYKCSHVLQDLAWISRPRKLDYINQLRAAILSKVPGAYEAILKRIIAEDRLMEDKNTVAVKHRDTLPMEKRAEMIKRLRDE